MYQPGVMSYNGSSFQNWTGNPYDSGAYFGEVDYGSTGLLGSAALVGAWSPLFGISTATNGFYGGKFGGLRGVGRYLSGLNSDVMQARKYAGVTAPSQMYAKMAGTTPGLGRFAPTLSHLGPTRFFATWSAIAGNEGAMQSLAAMTELRKAAGIGLDTDPSTIGSIYRNTFRKKTGLRFNFGELRGTPFRDFEIRKGVPWGSAIDGASLEWIKNRFKVFNMDSPSARFAGEEALRGAGNYDGALTAKYSDWMLNMGEKAKAGKLSGKAFMTAGKAIKPIANIGARALVGVDVYGLSMFIGSMTGKLTLAGLSAPVNTYTALTSEMHRGMFMTSSNLSPFVGATGRQRAMANIYDKQLNLRQVMGNEAAYMSGWGL